MSVKKSRLESSNATFGTGQGYMDKRYSRIKFSRGDAAQPCSIPHMAEDNGNVMVFGTGKNQITRGSRSVAPTNNQRYGADI